MLWFGLSLEYDSSFSLECFLANWRFILYHLMKIFLWWKQGFKWVDWSYYQEPLKSNNCVALQSFFIDLSFLYGIFGLRNELSFNLFFHLIWSSGKDQSLVQSWYILIKQLFDCHYVCLSGFSVRSHLLFKLSTCVICSSSMW